MSSSPLLNLQHLQESFTKLCIENRERERNLDIANRAKEEYALRTINEAITEAISVNELKTDHPAQQPVTRNPSSQFLDKRGDGIAIGDRVWVLSTATASFPGDLAEVTQLGKKKVHIKILKGFRKMHRRLSQVQSYPDMVQWLCSRA